MTVQNPNQSDNLAKIHTTEKNPCITPLLYNPSVFVCFNFHCESDSFFQVSIGVSMDLKNGERQAFWIGAGWFEVPTRNSLSFLLKIIAILTGRNSVPFFLSFVFFVAQFVPASAQVANGDFSSGATGWTSSAPANSSLTYTGGQLTAVSDNNGGTNQRTFASQTITTGDPGFLSYQLVNWTTADYGRFDYPTVRIGGTYYWITTAGALSTNQNPPSIDNDNAPIGVSGVHVLGNTTTLIGFGVTSVDSCCGVGTAIWDNIEFQQLTQSPAAQTTPFNTTLTMSGANAPQVATNSGAGTMSVTLTVTNGTLTLASTAGLTVTGDGTASVTLSGTPAAINTALDGLQYAPTTGHSGASALTFFANGGGTSDTDTIGITVGAPSYSFTITKTEALGVATAAGQVINYTITVTNTGTGAFVSPVISDVLDQNGTTTTITPGSPTGDGGVSGTMEAGEIWVYTPSHTVTQGQMDDANDLVNTATFNPTETGALTSSATTTITASPSLAVTKLADDDSEVTAGQTITYTYTITNDGNQTISDISMGDAHGGSGTAPAPDADTATLTDNGPTGDSTNSTTGDNDWDALAPGDVLTVTATYVVTQNDVDTLQ